MSDYWTKEAPNIIIPESIKRKVGERYMDAIWSAGGRPMIMNIHQFSRAMPADMHGLLLPGGRDINPFYYRQEEHQKCGLTDYTHDTIEFRFFKEAMYSKIPTLGICRGMQLICVETKGSLYQDISLNKEITHGQQHIHINHSMEDHDIHVEYGSLLYRILQKQSFKSNSFHHQCVKGLGTTVNVDAFAPDGLIEAISLPENQHPFCLGVQFHPEYIDTTENIQIIEWFIQKARERLKIYE